MSDSLKFHVAEIKGKAAYSVKYRPLTHHDTTIGVDEFARLLGMKMGKDETIGRFAANATYDVIVENLMKGYRVDLGWITLDRRDRGEFQHLRVLRALCVRSADQRTRSSRPERPLRRAISA